MNGGRMRVSGWLIALVGSTLAAFLVVDAATTPDSTYWIVQSYPVALSLLLAGVGVLLARGRLIADRFCGRLLAWMAVGVLALSLLVAYLYGLSVAFAGYELLDRPVGILTITTFGALVGLLVGIYDARALERSRAIAQLSKVNDTLRIATGDLVAQVDRDALEQAMCDRLAASDAYEAAWIGRYDADNERVRAVRWAGLGGTAFDSLDVAVTSAETDASAYARAFNTGQMEVVENVREDEAMAQWRTAFERHGVEAMAVVPVVGADEVYGLLGIFTTQRNAFEEQERTTFTELGEAVGHAIDSLRAHEKLRLREAELVGYNDRLDKFASVVSHDLRNPLSVILGRIEYMRAREDDEHLAAIERAGRRMEVIITDLLALSRAGRSIDDRRPVALAAAAHESWANVETGATTFEVQVPERETVDADRVRLLTVFENLFRNAVEHGSTSPDSQGRRDAVEHGSTSPDSQARQDAVGHDDGLTTVRVGVLAPASTADGPLGGFFVEDDGSGIPEADREHIFDHGYTTNTNGTGFGLAIVEEIVEAHGWTISVTASASGGARFEIRTDGSTPHA
jgi:signal transduction histidine kinase